MSLIIIPDTNGDSFISVNDANDIITKNSVHFADWQALTDNTKEIYLRIATTRILDVVSDEYFDLASYNVSDSCLPQVTALMGIHDVAYGISKDINPNLGVVTKEKVGDLEIDYYHGNASKMTGKNRSPFPSNVIKCLESYGATNLQGCLKTIKLVRS